MNDDALRIFDMNKHHPDGGPVMLDIFERRLKDSILRRAVEVFLPGVLATSGGV